MYTLFLTYLIIVVIVVFLLDMKFLTILIALLLFQHSNAGNTIFLYIEQTFSKKNPALKNVEF